MREVGVPLAAKEEVSVFRQAPQGPTGQGVVLRSTLLTEMAPLTEVMSGWLPEMEGPVVGPQVQ